MKVLQVVIQGSSILGLADDNNMYQWLSRDGVWEFLGPVEEAAPVAVELVKEEDV